MRWSARRRRVKRARNRSGSNAGGFWSGGAALEFSAHEGETFGETAHHMEAVEHMAGVRQVCAMAA